LSPSSSIFHARCQPHIQPPLHSPISAVPLPSLCSASSPRLKKTGRGVPISLSTAVLCLPHRRPKEK